MPYTAATPEATQRINITQPMIKDNFTELLPYGLGYSHFKNQSPAPTFAANVNGIYNAVFGTTSTNELFIHRQGVSGLLEVPFTASKMSNTNAAGSVNGWMYLPCGSLVKWGMVAANAASVIINPTAVSGGPNFTQVFQVLVSPRDTNSNNVAFNCGQRTTPNNTSGTFNAYCRNFSSTTSIAYLVIGI